LVGAHDYEKTELGYQNLIERLNRARRAGLIPFDAIRDDGAEIVTSIGWDSQRELIESWQRSAKYFRLDRCVLALQIQRAAEMRCQQPWNRTAHALAALKAVRYRSEARTIVPGQRYFATLPRRAAPNAMIAARIAMSPRNTLLTAALLSSFGAVGLIGGPSGAAAAPILVANPSFEILPVGGLPLDSCGPGCFFSSGTPIPGWNSSGQFGQFQPGVQDGNFTTFNSVPSGITVAYSNGGSISQTVGPVGQVGVTYTLQVDVGFRKDLINPGTVALVVGSHTTDATGAVPQMSGNWVNYTASYTAVASDAGAPISILLSSPGSQGDWDNVRLSDNITAIPEPMSLAVIGVGILALGAVLRHRQAGAGRQR
jgi:hypothetical protein